MLLGIVGKKRSGKTTVATYLEKQGFKRLAFGTALKQVVRHCFGMDDRNKDGLTTEQIEQTKSTLWRTIALENLNTCLLSVGLQPLSKVEVDTLTQILVDDPDVCYRRLLQYVGTEVYRNRSPQIWIYFLFPELISCMINETNAIVDDVRFLNESNMIRELGGSLIRVISADDDLSDAHVSETEMDRIVTDYNIINEKKGVDQLYQAIDQLLIKMSNQ